MVKQQSLSGGEEFQRSLALKYGAKLQDLQTGGAGVGSAMLKRILEDQGLAIDHRQLATGEIVPMLLASSERRPIIFHVAWPSSGGHFVVCAGSNRAGAVILDPWYGLVEVPLTFGGSGVPKAGLPYNPRPNAQGAFSGWFARVTGTR